MTRFAAGQVITIFRSRLRDDAAPGYHETADEMLALAREVPGFVDFKSFHADDGERVSLVTFDGPEAQRAWREHVAHREAQRRGRADWYAAYSLQVGGCTTAHEFEHPPAG
jgi:heme-degrading monooxygenase HmoA